MATTIKFGTDGWRAIIAKDFTTDNVARVAYATGEWVKQNYKNPSIVIGHDCRFAGQLFMETAVKVFIQQGIPVKMAKGFVSTPMVSLSTQSTGSSLGVVLTASHNPPSYNGFKLKAHYGGPLTEDKVQEIEDIIPNEHGLNLESISIEEAIEAGTVTWIDMESEYVEHVKANFDIEAIKNSGLRLAYDAMYGAGQNVLKRILPDMEFLHCDYNPSFMGQAPEPIAKNLKELEEFIKTSGTIDCALATDGDADRIGLYNADGEFVDSHHLILLLVHYLVKYKSMSGDVVTAFSCTPRIQKMAQHYGLNSQVTKIGFKYVAGIMVDEDVLVGGEESGGIATKGHIPERDGIWMGMIIWEFMAKSGKTLNELIEEVYAIVGPFKFERNDLHITDELKKSIIDQCKAGKFTAFGDYKVERVETVDGFKFFFDENRWMMIRPSGTEPVLRTYAEAPELDEVRKILAQTEATICK